jgi:5'-deoxynucleotidase
MAEGQTMSHFFAYLYRLRFIRRWSLMRNAVPENVAEHSFDVAVLTHALCSIAERVFGKDVDTGRAVILALFHDVTEVITGDIPAPVKHHSSQILRGMRTIEQIAGTQLLDMVPAEFRPVYDPLIHPTPSDAALHWVKAADKLAAYLKCATEVAAGNREFAVAKRQLEDIVRDLDMPEVTYYLREFAPSFERTLDEISE